MLQNARQQDSSTYYAYGMGAATAKVPISVAQLHVTLISLVSLLSIQWSFTMFIKLRTIILDLDWAMAWACSYLIWCWKIDSRFRIGPRVVCITKSIAKKCIDESEQIQDAIMCIKYELKWVNFIEFLKLSQICSGVKRKQKKKRRRRRISNHFKFYIGTFG